jgi:hypothetical protein
MRIASNLLGKLLKSNAISVAYGFFALYIILTLIRIELLVNLVLFLVITIYVCRIWLRYVSLRNFQFIEFEPLDLKSDSKQRGEQILDIVICTAVFVLLLMQGEVSNYVGADSFVNGFLAVLCILVPVIYLSISQNSFLLKTISIFFTTIYGIFIGVFGVLFTLAYLINLFQGTTNHLTLPFDSYNLVILSIAFDSFKLEILIFGVVSFFVQLIFWLITPAYQLGSLENAYKLLNFLVAMIAAITLILSPNLYGYVMKDKDAVIAELHKEHASNKVSSGELEEIKANINDISRATYTNAIAILFVPYTLGSLFISILITLKRSRCEKKALRLMNAIIENYGRTGGLPSTDIHAKQVVYLSGDKHATNLKMLTIKRVGIPKLMRINRYPQTYKSR